MPVKGATSYEAEHAREFERARVRRLTEQVERELLDRMAGQTITSADITLAFAALRGYIDSGASIL